MFSMTAGIVGSNVARLPGLDRVHRDESLVLAGRRASTACSRRSKTYNVVRGGVEPPTFRFSGGRSYQLSYLTVAGPRLPERKSEAGTERS
jgi:hypothetical protein